MSTLRHRNSDCQEIQLEFKSLSYMLSLYKPTRFLENYSFCNGDGDRIPLMPPL